MRVVIAPDSFGGTLRPSQASEAMARGWLASRPDDEVVLRPMSDGGEGLLDAVAASLGASGTPVERHDVEVVGPRGLAAQAAFLLLGDGTAVVESALACGLALLDPDQRDPRRTTTWGVGQLLAAAADAGARRVLVGLGGSATVDGGAGALSGLGYRITVGDGSGLKIGGEDLPRVAGISPGWVPDAVRELEVVLLADVRHVLGDAARVFGPQKGADEATVQHLESALATWADVVERTFDRPGLRDRPGTGAAGGLGFGLAGALGGAFVAGAEAVGDLVGLGGAIAGADVVVTGEGRLDATSLEGKVVGTVRDLAVAHGSVLHVVVGQSTLDEVDGAATVLAASPSGPSEDAAARLEAAVARVAAG